MRGACRDAMLPREFQLLARRGCGRSLSEHLAPPARRGWSGGPRRRWLGWCERTGSFGRTVTVKLRYADFRTLTRCRTGAGPIASRAALAEAAIELARGMFPLEKKTVRLLGVAVSGLGIGPARALSGPRGGGVPLPRLRAEHQQPERAGAAGGLGHSLRTLSPEQRQRRLGLQNADASPRVQHLGRPTRPLPSAATEGRFWKEGAASVTAGADWGCRTSIPGRFPPRSPDRRIAKTTAPRSSLRTHLGYAAQTANAPTHREVRTPTQARYRQPAGWQPLAHSSVRHRQRPPSAQSLTRAAENPAAPASCLPLPRPTRGSR